jgi:diketogulonate reductase-like aldo/keto reductase
MLLNRRAFLQAMLAMGAGLVLPPLQGAAAPQPYRRLIPATGESLPVIGLGSWITFAINPDDQTALAKREQILREFLRRGGGVLDSSPMYGTAQAVIGRCLRRIDDHKGLFAATKVWIKGNREGLLQMEQSRALWGVPRFDLMQVHNLLDWQTHLPRLLAMKEEGTIRYVGVTTSHGRRHEELVKIMRSEKLDFVQFTYNILDREAEEVLLPLAADRGIAVIINRPFQRGGLFEHVGRQPLPGFARDIDCDNWAQFFLKFIVSHPAVTCAIPATSKLAHLQENMAAAYGRLPEPAMRQKMADYVRNL